MKTFALFNIDEQIALSAILFAATLIIGILCRRIVYGFLRRAAKRSKNDSLGNFNLLLENALRVPYVLWLIIVAMLLALHVSPYLQQEKPVIEKVVAVLLLISFTIVAAGVLAKFAQRYSSGKGGTAEMSSITKTAVYIGVYLIGGTLILNNLGVSITPILTALGVGGLAVALALQDTLANLFAGFYISLSGKIRVGNYIKLNTGEEGNIADITWGSTLIHTLGNNSIIVPNVKIMQANVTNYSLPSTEMGSGMTISVPYQSDVAKIERILIEETIEASKHCTGLLAEPAPSVSFTPGFSPSSLDLSLNYRIRSFTDQFDVQDKIRRRIFARFAQEQIPLAYPLTTIAAAKQ